MNPFDGERRKNSFLSQINSHCHDSRQAANAGSRLDLP